MNTLEKLKILGAGAKYDTSCGGDERKRYPEKPVYGIYNAIAYGKCMPLLKVLQSNHCIHDCKYCFNSRDCKRTSFEPGELAGVFRNFLSKGYVEGLFLSSGVVGDPDLAVEKVIETAEIVRKGGFGGYMHLKALPGVSRSNLERLGELADRVSINIEAPSKGRLNELSGTKDFRIDILRRMGWLGEMKRKGRLKNFTTQFVLGANDESDIEYLDTCRWMYGKLGLWRAYFSAFSPVKGTPLGHKKGENPLREHALYQADWLYRVYRFAFEEVRGMVDESGFLPLGKDLKLHYANGVMANCPVDVNSAKFSELLRVPGIGPRSAERIMKKRTAGKRITGIGELKTMGVVVKRAMNFIIMDGGGRQGRLFEY
ncbi:MAG: radical SAM protein [Candidatus Micrarchaeota archaeon]